MGTFAIKPCEHPQTKDWYDHIRLRRPHVGGYDISKEAPRFGKDYDSQLDERRLKEYLRVFLRALVERGSVVVRESENVVADDLSLEKRFRAQSDKWARETAHLSSPNQRVMHPSYQAILGMGRENKEAVISLLLRDLQENRRAWFWALSYLAQDNPINPKDAGKMDKMIEAWVKWGKARGLL